MSDETPEKPFDPLQYPIRLIGAQLAVATALGIAAVIAFCALRIKYPQLYEARRARRRDLPVLSNKFFGWMLSLYRVTEEEVLEHAGLDAFVVSVLNVAG